MQQWYIWNNNQQAGPFTPAQLRKAAASGQIGPKTKVHTGDGNWFTASLIKELFSEAQLTQTANPTHATPPTAVPSIRQTDASSSPISETSSTVTRRATSTSSGFIATTLLADEEIMSRARIHPFIFLIACRSGIVTSLAVIINTLFYDVFIYDPLNTGAMFAYVIMFVVGLGAFFIFVIRIIQATIIFLTTETVVTNKRVLKKTGLIRRDSIELLLKHVEGMEVKQGIIARIFNFGDLTVKGTGGAATRFQGISRPIDFRRAVQQQLDVLQRN